MVLVLKFVIFLHPIGSNGALEISDDSSAPCFGLIIVSVMVIRVDVDERTTAVWLPEAESWHFDLLSCKIVILSRSIAQKASFHDVRL